MLPSQWADANPRALRDGLDRSIRVAWRLMHQYRRRHAEFTAGPRFGFYSEQAQAQAKMLRALLDIRKGAA